ncbi:PTS fructose transporter subunit IIC, partial [Nakamurella sp.]|uniref:PTS fructose transporter subunit IIC n=1 Tax=Nakamurella sp. TaxID=1869182 RepID=UPI003B3ACBBE
SCPTGIAHTYMAAENLEQTGKDLGHEVQVETQGSAGTVPLSDDIIAAADGVIYAADLEVKGKERFAGKPCVDVGVKKAVHDPKAVLDAAIAAVENAPKAGTPEAAAAAAAAPAPSKSAARDVGVGTRVRQWLMTGVSYMIPFVAAGGILIALGFLFGGDEVVTKLYGGTFEGVTYENVAGSLPLGFPSGQNFDTLLAQAGFAGILFALGKISFFLLVPVLSGYIAFGIADRPGLVPGFVGGLLAAVLGAGFLGGLISGFAAGGLAYALTRLRVPKGVRGIMPVVVIPLVSVIVVGLFMIFVVGKPVAALTTALTDWLNGLAGASGIVLGAILGLMMAFDMGGPLNKVAYTFAAAGLTTAVASESAPAFQIMAAVMAAGMTPPLGMALATAVRKKLWTEAERENGLACWLLGASFITEGAIPFAAAHPLRVIPSCMVGSAVTGALVMGFGNELRAPHGGIFVLPLVSSPVLYLVAIAIGTVITAALVIFLMSLDARKTEAIAHREDVAEGVTA